jgi:hypothetical protein
MSGGSEELVTSPDQLKPTSRKPAYLGAAGSVTVLLLMLFGNHRGKVEDLWLIGSATIIVLIVLGDWAMRRNGIKR